MTLHIARGIQTLSTFLTKTPGQQINPIPSSSFLPQGRRASHHTRLKIRKDSVQYLLQMFWGIVWFCPWSEMNKHSGSYISPEGLITLQIYGQRTGYTLTFPYLNATCALPIWADILKLRWCSNILTTLLRGQVFGSDIYIYTLVF